MQSNGTATPGATGIRLGRRGLLKICGGVAAGALASPLLSACGKSASSASSGGGGATAEVSIFTESATYEGKLDGYVGKWFKDKVNTEVSVVPNSVGGTSRFATRLSTGNLGDLIVFTGVDDLKQALNANLLLDLSTKEKELPNLFRFKDAIARVKKVYDGKVMAMPSAVCLDSVISKTDPVVVPSMRYDYYKELGSPAIKDYWSYAQVAEQMVAAHPTTENGSKFYGLSLFSQWDSTNATQLRTISQSMGWTGNDGVNAYKFIDIDPLGKRTQVLIEEGSIYLQSLKWANGFYRKGLLDPDSATQTWDDYLKKAQKGQSALWVFGYTGDLNFNPANPDLTAAGKGYKRISNDSMKAADPMTSTFGSSWYWAVTKKAKDLDGTLKLLNFLYSDEGGFGFEMGPEGVLWKRNSEGIPTLTELGKQDWSAAIPADLGGGKKSDTFKSRVNGPTLDQAWPNPTYKIPANYQVWTDYLTSNASALDKQWTQDHGGALNMKELLVKNNQLAAFKPKDVPAVSYDDQLKVVANQVGNAIKQYSWKMIYASDDATFDSLKNEMVSKAQGLGLDKCVDFEKKTAQTFFDAS
ncbi:multiple sugar transport system substrate-binding protein/putative aldouronate transport system substrate-binding protein [Propionibacterium cyclohexanicum]|uniref:Multiple sugar transport system substrate-binding protein/putative aldouronate transport system substrate-binding protein n=1 Tax=Propionibacterium cyclohexanicum TaxID=64702 RepID=A0A1H9S9T2_9ACTN|nr:extracellular solute-binding protein [Propionibacterium cyclohexanicum]SER81678.1 multiple sugar transport system substrate-binding protein/putative aldouronate transport system substrate-binding protein [Propionibacterium cyclohexanicum]